jgi:peroxiredoxin 2/4
MFNQSKLTLIKTTGTMKKTFFTLLLAFSMSLLWSQDKVAKPAEDRNFRIPLIGEAAPSFTAETTNGVLNFPGDYGRSWKILFSHPQDFTPVCSTEILELAYLQDEFDKLGVKLAVVSTDPLSSHLQWKKALESLNLNNRGTVKIKFPIVDDENISVSKAYGMIHRETNSTKSVRGVFIISPDNLIEAIYFYPMSVGRSTDELLRMVTALKATADSKVLTPVNWKAGNDVLVPLSLIKNISSSDKLPEGYYFPAWYLMFKKEN